MELFRSICFLFLFLNCLVESTSGQTVKADSVKQLLCDKKWHLIKLTDINGGGKSMGGDLFNIDTKFNSDGTIETSTSGKITADNWKLSSETMTLETDQLKDPKTGQEKVTIIEITDKLLKVQITYRGNNIMQYDYQSY